MSDHAARLALKTRLLRTWPAFFERYGNFTNAQLAAIPALLDGQNIVLCSPTASGKTEAAVAPLIERHCPPVRVSRNLHLLYLTPTRALANDLLVRLKLPLEALGLTLGIKTRDQSTFRPNRPPDLLLTTPESVDSLLAGHAKIFANVRAIVIDELHLFDDTPRGDQLRVLLNRIRRVRAYAAERGDAPDAHLQYVALSATLPAPLTTAARYFDAAQVIQGTGKRAIQAEQLALTTDSATELNEYLASFRARGWRKALVFCNSRAEVEGYATAVRTRSPFGNALYVHYSNIEPERRHEIERQFAEANAAICFSSSTLELGIDIGDIDVVILIGPPGSSSSFIQRIGRGNRRSHTIAVACFYRSPLEQLLFAALLDEHQAAALPTTHYSFRPAVAVQQIFSLIKQSPTAALRLNELVALFEGMLTLDDLRRILAALQQRGYLKDGRPGEWRAGARLNQLIDQQSSDQAGPSIYSNIQNNDSRLFTIRDQHTQQTVARVDALWLHRDSLTLEGRPVAVEWVDGEAIWVTTYQSAGPTEQPIYRSARQLLSYELVCLLPIQLGLPADAAPLIGADTEWSWFHWLGDLYGRAALDLMRYQISAVETEQVGLYLRLTDELRSLPIWNETQVKRYLEDQYRRYEGLLALGPFQALLPTELRRRTVVEQFDISRFIAALSRLRAFPQAATPITKLQDLCE